MSKFVSDGKNAMGSWPMTIPTPRETAAEGLNDLLARAVEHVKAMTPEEREAMHEQQKKAWVAAEMAIGDEGTRIVTGHRETADHAELARLAAAATPGLWAYRDMTPNTYGPAFVDADDVRNLAICGEAVGRSETHGFCLQVDSEVRMANAAFIAAANPATVLALLSEIAVLCGEKDRIGRVLATMQEAIPAEYHPNGSGIRLFIADLKDRATQAERQRDELRKALETIGEMAPSTCETSLAHAMAQHASQALANQGADQ